MDFIFSGTLEFHSLAKITTDLQVVGGDQLEANCSDFDIIVTMVTGLYVASCS